MVWCEKEDLCLSHYSHTQFIKVNLNLDFSKRTRFIDLESDQEIITDPWYIQLEYKKKITAFCEEIKQYCMQKKIDYVQLTTDTELGVTLSEYLIKRKRLN